MAFFKFIFLLLVAIPFAIFLLFILDRLIDELNNKPTKVEDNSSPETRVKKRRAARRTGKYGNRKGKNE